MLGLLRYKYVKYLTALVHLLTIACAQPARPCRSDDIRSVTVIDVQATFEVLERISDIRLILKVSWNISNQNDVPIDGFLIRIYDPRLINSPSFQPTDQCIAEMNDGFWINSVTCTDPVIPFCPPEMDINPNGTSLCSSSSSVLGDLTCIGTPFHLTENGRSFISLRSDARSFSILANFHIYYQVEIRPYYRQYTNLDLRPVSFVASDCHEVIMQIKNVSLAEAVSTCCDFDVPHFRPLFLHITEVKANVTAGTAEVTFMWYPPIFQENMAPFFLFLNSDTRLSTSERPITGEAIAVPNLSNPPQALQVSCYNSTYVYQTVISNVLLHVNYSFIVGTRYLATTSETFCIENQHQCNTEIQVNSSELNRCIDLPVPCNSPAPTTAESETTEIANTDLGTQPEGCPAPPTSNQIPILFNTLSIIPNFFSSSVDVTLSWLPPLVSFGSSDVTFSVSSLPMTNEENMMLATTHNDPIQMIDSALQCFGFPNSFQILLSNLSINVDYSVFITAIFPDSSSYSCIDEDNPCVSTMKLLLQEFNFCDASYNPCADKSKCRRNTNNGIISYNCNSASSMGQNNLIAFAALQIFLFVFMQFTF